MFNNYAYKEYNTNNLNSRINSANKVELVQLIYENIAQRLYVAKEVFINLLGFKDPLKSKRYKDVKYIDVHIMSSEKSSAGDEIVTFKYKMMDTKDKVVSMQIRNDLTKSTLTPSHEYFHILQNSYTMFKNRWYSESTARWSESIFKKGVAKQDNLPNSQKQIKELFDKTYDAEGIFGKLTYLCDTNNGVFKREERVNDIRAVFKLEVQVRKPPFLVQRLFCKHCGSK